jgi:hypothetical protein
MAAVLGMGLFAFAQAAWSDEVKVMTSNTVKNHDLLERHPCRRDAAGCGEGVAKIPVLPVRRRGQKEKRHGAGLTRVHSSGVELLPVAIGPNAATTRQSSAAQVRIEVGRKGLNAARTHSSVGYLTANDFKLHHSRVRDQRNRAISPE